ncbi:Ig-like domain-containing protein [Nocardioides sp. URHA0020]|uniref:Ig-like domain-containing protein n=1 Tax=Nocardioides sp. URHA0020 TaxID=1380392 RepID=UPI00048E3255|nr:Ig-like domain-containing protein [Nocardioides sp. URHA0020]
MTAAHAADTVPPATHGIDFDYFKDAYPGVGADSVFETVTLERFKYLLRDKSGNFAFVIGDPNDANTQATLGYINQVAKAYGITKIYNFTPKIDGGKWNLWNWNDLASVTGGAALTYWQNEGPTGGAAGNPGSYYSTHTDDYLNKDTEPEFIRTDGVITGPYLFVYNKDRQIDVGGTPTDDHIVSSLSDRKTASDLDTPGEVEAYKAEVQDVLGAVPAADYATNSAFQFWKDEANRRHNSTYADASIYGGDILTDADNADGWRVQPITYPEWIALLKKSGDIPFLFGGTWCHNTRAIVKDVNKDAQKYGVKKVYNFDYSLFSTSNGGSNYDHSRSSGQNITTGTGPDTRLLYPSQVYGQTVNTYLTNAIAEYGRTTQVTTSTPHYYFPDGDVTKPITEAVRIQVGHLLTYNKDHVDAAGDPAPVVDQALRQNDNGGNTEYMTEWWYVKGKDLPASDGSFRGSSAVGSNALANQRAFAKEGIDDIEQVFRGFTDELPSSTTVTGVGASVKTGAAVTLNVTLDASDYAPYQSTNGASSSDPAGTLTAQPRGWVRLLDGNGTEVDRKRVTRGGRTSFALGTQATPGTTTYTVEYLGRGDLIAPSSKEVSFVVGATTTTLSGPTSITVGQGGQFTATVSSATATGTVALHGLPGGDVTGDVSNGAVTLDVPASVPTGSYEVTASYSGDATNDASTSAPRTLAVVANTSTTTLAGPTSTTYGAAGTLTATVTDGATGTVRLHGLPATIDATVVDHVATFTLPSDLAVGSYQVHAEYLGDDDFGSSESSAHALSVGKAAAKLTASAPTRAYGAAGTVTVTVGGVGGLVPTGSVKVSEGSTVLGTRSLSGGKVTITLPRTATVKKHTLKVQYVGSDSYAARSATVFFTVTKGLAKAPTFTPQGKVRASKAGSATITVAAATGLAKPGGKVKVTLTKGSTSRSVSARLSKGRVVARLPKLAKGTWAVKVTYLGDATYAAGRAKAFRLTVTK